MKKRILSGLLAAVLLLGTAFAAGGDALPTAETAADTTLTFTVTLPDGMDTMTEETADRLLNVTERRLAQLELYNAVFALNDERTVLTVTLPEGTEAPDGLADFLTQPNVLSIKDATGTVSLTGADILSAEAGQAAEGDGGPAYIQLTPTEDAQATLDTLTEDNALSVQLDGQTVGETAAYNADDALLTITGGLDLNTAKLYVARIMAGTLPVALSVETPETPTTPVFPDVAGHWAEQSLNRAVRLGLLNGVDGMMLPDNAVKRSEAIVILNRTLGASVADSTSGLTGTPSNAWYANDLGKAIHLGLIASNDSRNFDTASTRAEAFELLARAFVYDRAEAAEDELHAFTDAGSMTDSQKQAAAALVSAGIVNGSSATTLSPQASLTRAEFVTMLLRIVGTFPSDTPETAQPGGTLFSTAEAIQLNGTQSNSDYIFAADTTAVNIDGAALTGRVVLKGAENTSLTAQNNTSLSTLALDPAGQADVTLSGGAAADTLVIAGKGGAVNYAGAAGNIEITASNRTIHLSGMQADALTITGTGNTIVLDGAAKAVAIVGGAKNNKLTMNGAADTLLVAGVGSTVDGTGKAGSVDIRAVNCEVTLEADSKIENIDPGLTGITLQMGVPEKVKAGGSLVTQVSFAGVSENKVCSAQWYKDGVAMANYRNDNFTVTSTTVSSITTDFTFTKDMKTSVTMGFKLTYDNPSTGETEELYVEKTVPIENYSDEWYYQRDVNRVLGLVSSTYRGNYTSSYAINNDYETYEKEIWVNAKGYSSKSQYLLWINRAYQHVNVFQGSKGNWKLIKSFLVGTGAASTPTPTGLTTVSYKSAAGWTTSTYTVRPVVGFYPGTGYAFHSRLCYPGTDTEYDFSAGYPVSHGCVRMYKNDIKWIYNNIPVGTTVAIY
nr:L,D-transpeptidase family protein [uncultured Agathobaculum sp.]